MTPPVDESVILWRTRWTLGSLAQVTVTWGETRYGSGGYTLAVDEYRARPLALDDALLARVAKAEADRDDALDRNATQYERLHSAEARVARLEAALKGLLFALSRGNGTAAESFVEINNARSSLRDGGGS